MSEEEEHFFARPHSDIALKARDIAGLEALGFEASEVLGRGAFALVFGVRDKRNRSLAVKKVFMPNGVCPKSSVQNFVPPHPNVLRLLDAFEKDENLGNGRVAYEVYEKFDISLDQLIRHFRQRKKSFPPRMLHHVTRSLLEGLRHLHGYGIIHRDLKPSNVLLKFAGEATEVLRFRDSRASEVRVVISDLDHAVSDSSPRSTAYVCTRFYRAPELLLGFLGYSCAVDLWALGCVLAELVRLRPLFSADSGTAVLGKIILTLGNFHPELVERYTNEKIPLAQVIEVGSLESKITGADPKITALIKSLLIYDDTKRLSAGDALCLLEHETPLDKF